MRAKLPIAIEFATKDINKVGSYRNLFVIKHQMTGYDGTVEICQKIAQTKMRKC